MTERGTSRRAALLGLGLLGAGACVDFQQASGGDPRFIDRACDSGQCTLAGSARFVGALTADSRGVRLGPGRGSLTIQLQSYYNYGVDAGPPITVLVAGSGAGKAGGDPFPLKHDYEWQPATVVATGDPNDGGVTGYQLVVETTDETSQLDLVDVKAPGYDYSGSNACAVAHVGLRRR